jgi:integrase
VTVTLAAGLGLRQGEVFGLAPDDVDWFSDEVTVRRQVKLLGARPVFAPPKGGKTRTVPLPATVKAELAAHLARFPARTVALPCRELDGGPVPVPLVVTTAHGTAVNRRPFNENTWRPALAKADVPDERGNGMHALRHFYASVLLDGASR